MYVLVEGRLHSSLLRKEADGSLLRYKVKLMQNESARCCVVLGFPSALYWEKQQMAMLHLVHFLMEMMQHKIWCYTRFITHWEKKTNKVLHLLLVHLT
jgi:hypothetical protein